MGRVRHPRAASLLDRLADHVHRRRCLWPCAYPEEGAECDDADGLSETAQRAVCLAAASSRSDQGHLLPHPSSSPPIALRASVADRGHAADPVSQIILVCRRTAVFTDVSLSDSAGADRVRRSSSGDDHSAA